LGKFAMKIRQATHGMRGFRMEMLGVMFFGKMLQKTFTGLLRPALEVYGVFDIFRIMLMTLFLPVVELLFKPLMNIMLWFMKLPKPVKKSIGIFVLLMITLGTVLFLVGSFALGIGSLILAFGSFVTPLSAVVGGFLALLAITGIIELFKSLSKKTKDLDDNLVEMGFGAGAFDILKEKAGSAWKKIKEVFSGLKAKIGSWLAEAAPKMITNGAALVTNLGKGILQNAEKIGDAFGTLVSTISSFISEKGPDLIDFGLTILTKIISGIKDNAENIGSAISKIATSIGTWIGDNAETIADLGIKFDSAFLDGFSEGLSQSKLIKKIAGFIESLSRKPIEFISGGSAEEFYRARGLRHPIFNPTGERGYPSIPEPIIINNTFTGPTSDEILRAIEESGRVVVEEINRRSNQ